MNTFDKFMLAERMELVFADVYRLLAERFADESEYAALFTRLEQEEIQHAQRIRMLRKRYTAPSGGLQTIELDCEGLQAALDAGKALQQDIAGSKTLQNISDITLKLATLERRFADLHAETVIGIADPGLRALFESLASQDREHASLLSLPPST